MCAARVDTFVATAVPAMGFWFQLRKRGLTMGEVLIGISDSYALHFQTRGAAAAYKDYQNLKVRVEKPGDKSHGQIAEVELVDWQDPITVMVRMDRAHHATERAFKPSELFVSLADLAAWRGEQHKLVFQREDFAKSQVSVDSTDVVLDMDGDGDVDVDDMKAWAGHSKSMKELLSSRDDTYGAQAGIRSQLCKQLLIQQCMGKPRPPVAILSRMAIQFGAWVQSGSLASTCEMSPPLHCGGALSVKNTELLSLPSPCTTLLRAQTAPSLVLPFVFCVRAHQFCVMLLLKFYLAGGATGYICMFANAFPLAPLILVLS